MTPATTWASPALCAVFNRVNDEYDRLVDSPRESDQDRCADLDAAMSLIEEADARLERASLRLGVAVDRVSWGEAA